MNVFNDLRQRYGRFSLIALTLISPILSMAQANYPSKPIVVISPFPPGGLNDTSARSVAKAIQEVTGKTTLVENRPGGGTMIALEHLSKQPADGYNLLIAGDTNMAVMPHLTQSLNFSLTQDFKGVTSLVVAPTVLLIRPGLEAKTVNELVAIAQARPGKLSFASAGNATPPHMVGELFKALTKIEVTHVPYKGAIPALIDIMGNNVDFIFIDLPSASAQLKSGKVHALAVTSPKRLTLFPELPTVAESGLPGFEGRSWQGVIVRKGTPPEIITWLNRVILEGMKKPLIGGIYATQGAELFLSSPTEFDQMIKDERNKFGQLISSANIKLE